MKFDIVMGRVSRDWMLLVEYLYVAGLRELSWCVELVELGVVGCKDGVVGII